MPDHAAEVEIALLLELIDRAYDAKGWQGANLRGCVRGLSARDASWRPSAGRHNIAEQVLHAAYWKYAVRRRLGNEIRGSFPLKGNNWFPVADDLDDASWRLHLKTLDSEHRAFRGAVAKLPASRLRESPAGGKVSFLELILGVASHDAYHTGQIQLIKRLRPSPDGALPRGT